MIEKLTAKYAVIAGKDGDYISLYDDIPAIRPAFESLLEKVTITIDNKQAHIDGSRILFEIKDYVSFDMADPDDVKEVERRFLFWKWKTKKFRTRYWVKLKNRDPFRLTTNRYSIVDCRAVSETDSFEMPDGEKVVMASMEGVNKSGSYVDRVLEALGHPEAIVTDLSSVNDFMPDDNEIQDAIDKLGIVIGHDDTIVEIAKRLEQEDAS